MKKTIYIDDALKAIREHLYASKDIETGFIFEDIEDTLYGLPSASHGHSTCIGCKHERSNWIGCKGCSRKYEDRYDNVNV